MSTHQIRLRGGWEIIGDQTDDVRPIGLPTIWAEAPRSPIRLIRRFGRPPSRAEAETLVLAFADVPGLVRARLNGQEIEPRVEGDRLICDGPFAARNVLEIEADLGRLSEFELRRPWGSIALEVRSDS